MTEIDIHFVLLEISSAVSENFQFWMATTFAVVVATYSAGDKLPVFVRSVLAVIYSLAATMFYLRYQTATDQVAYYAKLLADIESELPAAKLGAVTYLRRTVMVAGSILAVVFIFKPHWTDIEKSRPKVG